MPTARWCEQGCDRSCELIAWVRPRLGRQLSALVPEVAFAFQRPGVFIAAEDIFVQLLVGAAECLEPQSVGTGSGRLRAIIERHAIQILHFRTRTGSLPESMTPMLYVNHVYHELRFYE